MSNIETIDTILAGASSRLKANKQSLDAIENLEFHGRMLYTMARLVDTKVLTGEWTDAEADGIIASLEQTIDQTAPLRNSCRIIFPEHLEVAGPPEHGKHGPNSIAGEPREDYEDIYHYFNRGYDAVLNVVNNWSYACMILREAKEKKAETNGYNKRPF